MGKGASWNHHRDSHGASDGTWDRTGVTTVTFKLESSFSECIHPVHHEAWPTLSALVVSQEESVDRQVPNVDFNYQLHGYISQAPDTSDGFNEPGDTPV
jgi:hypothetical protein